MFDKMSGPGNALPYLAMVAVVVGNVLGNVFLKIGSTVDESRALLFGLFGWQTLLGLCFFAGAIVCYAVALKSLPLHMAQALAALQYVGGIAAAAIYFGEAITGAKWIGMALICAGLAFVLG